MSSLVARFASNSFWLGRYVERAEDLARILDVNETYARDNPQGPDWSRILSLYHDLDRFLSLHDRIDARQVLHFYILDRTNPNSIASCVANARENARTVRHLISTEMWTHLNILYAGMRKLTVRDIRQSNLSRLTRKIITDCQTFEGIAEGTFFRTEPWRYYTLGKCIERADQTTRTLDMGYDQLSIRKGDAVAFVNWNVLLRSVSGYHAYRLRHPGESSPKDIAAFLLYDAEFPKSVFLCANRVGFVLRDLERRHGSQPNASLETARKELELLLADGPTQRMNPRGLHSYIDEVQLALGSLSTAIEQTYFPLEDTLQSS